MTAAAARATACPSEPNTSPDWGLGAVGMARPIDGPINGSQFFIQRAAWPGAGPTAVYNRFGTVIQGIATAQLLTGADRPDHLDHDPGGLTAKITRNSRSGAAEGTGL